MPGHPEEGRRPGGPQAWVSALVPPWVDRNLTIVLGARLAMSAARAIAGVVTALYLTDIGFSALELGGLFVGVTVASALMSSGIGLLSDRVGRRPFLVAVPLLAALASALYSSARTPALLFAGAALGSFGRGAGAGAGSVGPYQPAEAAFVAEAAPAEFRAAAFGRLAFCSAVGALAGGLLAGLAHTHPHIGGSAATHAYRPAFLAAAALAAIAGLAAFWLHEPRPDGGAAEGKVAGPERPNVGAARSGVTVQERDGARWRWPSRSWPVLWRFWITNGVNGFAIGLFGPFVSYWFHRRFGAGPGTIGLLFAVINLGTLVSTLCAAPIGRRVGTVRAIIVVRFITGLLLVPMALVPWFWVAGALYFVRMLAQRVGLPLRQSFTQDLAHPAERASVAGLSNLPSQATTAGSQAFAGYLFGEVSLAAPLVLGGVFQCANAALYVVLFERHPPRRLEGEGLLAGRQATPGGPNTASTPSPVTTVDASDGD